MVNFSWRCGEVFCNQCSQFKRRLSLLAIPDPNGVSYRVRTFEREVFVTLLMWWFLSEFLVTFRCVKGALMLAPRFLEQFALAWKNLMFGGKGKAEIDIIRRILLRIRKLSICMRFMKNYKDLWMVTGTTLANLKSSLLWQRPWVLLRSQNGKSPNVGW